MNVASKSLSFPVAIVALSGFYMHAAQVDNAVGLMMKKVDRTSGGHAFAKLSKSQKEIHVEGSPFITRTNSPSSRPKEDDDNEDNAKRRTIEEGFGHSTATATT